jgi:hypothetical protein
MEKLDILNKFGKTFLFTNIANLIFLSKQYVSSMSSTPLFQIETFFL